MGFVSSYAFYAVAGPFANGIAFNWSSMFEGVGTHHHRPPRLAHNACMPPPPPIGLA